MSAAIKAAKDLREDQVCVVVCPDNVRNYMTKFIGDNWMEARDLKESLNVNGHSWWDQKVSKLIKEVIEPQEVLVASTPCREVIANLKKLKIDQIAIIDEVNELLGLATTSNIVDKILEENLKLCDPIEKVLFKKFVKISFDDSVGKLSRVLEKENFVVALSNKSQNRMNLKDREKNQIILINKKDLLRYLPLEN